MYMCSLLFANPFMSTSLFKHYNNALRRYVIISCLVA